MPRMPKFFKVERDDNGRLRSVRFEWKLARGGEGHYLEVELGPEMKGTITVDGGSMRLSTSLDAEELGALRRFLAEAEGQVR